MNTVRATATQVALAFAWSFGSEAIAQMPETPDSTAAALPEATENIRAYVCHSTSNGRRLGNGIDTMLQFFLFVPSSEDGSLRLSGCPGAGVELNGDTLYVRTSQSFFKLDASRIQGVMNEKLFEGECSDVSDRVRGMLVDISGLPHAMPLPVPEYAPPPPSAEAEDPDLHGEPRPALRTILP